MSQNQQHKIMQQLNKFLRNFKATVTAKLRLIQSLLSDIGQYSHQILLSKIAVKQTIDHSEYLQNKTMINAIIRKLVYRFCLRINQFLEYRLCELKNRNEIFIKNQVTYFQRNLNNTFKQINQQSQLSSFLKQIITIQHNFSFRLLQKISQNANNISKNQLLTKQSIGQVAKTFHQKFPPLQQTKNILRIQDIHQKLYVDSKTGLSSTFMNKLNKRENHKKSNKNTQDSITSADGWNGTLPSLEGIRKNTSIQSTLASQNLSNRVLPYDPQADKTKQYHYSHTRRHTIDNKCSSEFNIVQGISPIFSRNFQSSSVLSKKQYYSSLNSYSNKQKYVNAISSLMELDQHPYGSYSEDYLMEQLTNLNKKNQVMLDKYMKTYNRKKTKSQKNLFRKLNNNEFEVQNTAKKNSITHKTIDNQISIKKQYIMLEKSLFTDMKKKKLPFIAKKSSFK